MEMWTPRADEPALLDWWQPLIEFARRLRAERFPWPVHLDEFEFAGRVDRRGKPAIWTYRHRVSGGFVAVDEEGRPYRFISYRRGPSLGRFTECDLRRAGWIAGLPDVVEPVAWPRPPGDVGVGRAVSGAEPSRDHDGPDESVDDPHEAWDVDEADPEPDEPAPAPPRPASSRRVARRHLRLVPGTGGDATSRPA